jgi:3-oxoacyl-[acyl-carrier protein] reductase
MINFEGKVVLVTGGSRGIGSATVKAIAAAGGDVIVHFAGNAAAAAKTAAVVPAGKSHIVQGDLNEPGMAKAVWDKALAWKGRIDVLVNNAGIFQNADVGGSDEDWSTAWQRVLQVNLVASADLSRMAVNTWHSANTGGIIINVSSRAAHRGDAPDQWPYAASKGGMVSLTKTIARAYAADGIYAYCVAPGFTETDMATGAFEKDPAFKEVVIRDIPMGEIAPASDIANTICFLASGLVPHATGQTIDVNGASYVR